MNRVICSILLALTLIFGWDTVTSRNLDSLWNTWSNKNLHDTIRLKALHAFAWEGYGYSQPDSAFHFAQMLYDFAEKAGNTDYMAKALNTQGNSHVVRGNYFNAFDCYRQSLAISEPAGNQQETANSLHSIGIIYYYQSDHGKALEYYQRSLKIRETINDPIGISKSLNNIGIVYSQQRRFEDAIGYFSRSLKLTSEMGDKRGVASALNNIGLIYKEAGKSDSAFNNYMLSLQISEQIGDKRDVAATLNNLAVIYEQWGDYDKAFDSFKRSVAIKENIGDKLGIAISYIAMGLVYGMKSDYHEAVKWCLKGLNVAEEVGSLTEQEKACECLYSGYKSLKNNNLALVYHERMLVFSDSIKDAETEKVIQQMEFAKLVLTDSITKAEEKMKIQQTHAAEVRKKNQTRNILIIATLLLLSGAVAMYHRMRFIRKSRAEISKEKDRSENLLLNILPEDVARELKEKGIATPRKYENVSILFTDFKDFTQQASVLSPEELVSELNTCFRHFDAICEKYQIEKIKTIGDAYMVAGGLPVLCDDAARKTVMAAIEMSEYILNRKKNRSAEGKFAFEMRAGIHTGTVIAGIVGIKKFQYDLWGDTVNMAARLESAGETGKVNISFETYLRIKDDPEFSFESRGELMVKGKGCTKMYFVDLNKPV